MSDAATALSTTETADTGPPATSGGRRWARASTPTVLCGVGLAVVMFYGALLRFDAIAQKYGPVQSPSWLQALQGSRAGESALRPGAMTWAAVPTYPHADGPPTRYRSDPYTYLAYAREMRAFYAAHRREPLFPFVTKVFLWLFDGQDVAVSFASAAFSIVAIGATYLLGALAFSRRVGLAAALAFAVEYDVVGWSVEGWRDDAFTAAVVLSAYAMLRYHRSPSRSNALLMGAVAGLACLVRITSLSFILPGFAVLLLQSGMSWRARLTGVGLGATMAAILVAPFLVNCWLTFGDPLYAINVHADVYRATEGQTVDVTQTAGGYLRQQFRSHPVRTADTFILGMTQYPFTNKWKGFDPWGSSIGTWLARASVVGLIVWVWSGAGRLLLIVLAGSLLPYAFTWRLIADWRFTEHAYPFFLVAAWFAIDRVVTFLVPSRLRALPGPGRRIGPAIAVGATLLVIATAVWITTRVLPRMVVAEALRAGEDVSITAGPRDAAFFVRGWAAPVGGGNVTTRAARGGVSALDVPLPGGRDYHMTVRLDPEPTPPEGATPDPVSVVVFLNDQALTTIELGWNPQRVGAYDLRVAAALIKPGINRMTFVAKGTGGGSFKIWYLRVRPVR